MIEAKPHLKKANITGGTMGEMLFAITKLPDQITTAAMAKVVPIVVFFEIDLTLK